jgi:hypothetical protein
MRQWHVNPKFLCDKHLFGEHVEHHMLAGTINKGVKISGYIKNNLVEPLSLQSRHDELVNEIVSRGFNHRSVLPEIDLSGLPSEHLNYKIDRESAALDLFGRCEKCRKRKESS